MICQKPPSRGPNCQPASSTHSHAARPALQIGVLLVVAVLLLAGCAPVVGSDQTARQDGREITLAAGQPAGQTFVARHGGLSGLDIVMAPGSDSVGPLVLHLRSDPLSGVDLATASLPAGAPASGDGFVHFSFPPILDSHTRYYYALLETSGTGQARLVTAARNSYGDGMSYAAGRPQDGQLSFRLTYDPLVLAADWLLTLLTWLFYGLAAAVVLFLAGYPLVRRLVHAQAADFTVCLILGGLGLLACWMALLAWLSLTGIKLNATVVRVLLGCALVAGGVLFVRDRPVWRRREFWLGQSPASTLALWAALLAAIGLRLAIGRGLVMLPGSDAYHHALIAELFAEQGGIPSSYEPYAPLTSFSYHFGFHSIVALVRWLLDSDLLATTKTTALVLNGAIAAVAALVAEQAAGRRRAGVITALFLGLIIVSPFCLLRWSRFTQTTGLLFLAGGLWAVLVKPRRAGWLLPAALIAGMVFSHYRVALYWVIFFGLVFVVTLWRRDWASIRDWFLLGAASLALAVPWIVRVLAVQLDPNGLRMVYPVLSNNNNIDRLEVVVKDFITNPLVFAGSALFAAAAWLRRRGDPLPAILVAWCIVLVAGALIVPMLGSAFWDITTTTLSLSIPLALLAGLGVDSLWSAGAGTPRLAMRTALAGGLLVACALGATHMPSLVYTVDSVRPGDVVAMNWIRGNTPRDAVFISDALQFDWSPGWVVGIGPGYWTPLLAGRASVVPPMIYSLEWSDHPELLRELAPFTLLFGAPSSDGGSLSRLFARAGVTHVILSGDNLASLNSGKFPADVHVREIFSQDRTHVLEVTP